MSKEKDILALMAKAEETLRLVRELSEQATLVHQSRKAQFTQERFNELPALVSRATFMEWTGLNRHDLKQGVDDETIKVHKRNGGQVAKYYKSQIAQMGGFKL